MEVPVYDIVGEKKVTSLPGECPERYSMKTNELYSAMKEITSEDNPRAVNKNSFNIKITDKKLIACVSIALISLFCFAFIFVAIALTEITKLKSEAALSTSSLNQLIMELRENISVQLSQDISALNNTLVMSTIGFQGKSQDFPASSCAAIHLIHPSSSSGYYWVTSSNGSAVCVYCDMTRSCGGITGGWTRVVSLDMRDNSTQCPSGLREKIIDGTTIRICVNRNTNASCSSDIFSTYNLPYSNVCGQIRAYQFGHTDAFFTSEVTIDGIYVDGVSLTHGHPRQHIWTFAAALDEVQFHTPSVCPCFNVSGYTPPPSFVGNDYFCDTGSSGHFQSSSEDPLWDGEGCEGTNMCCLFNDPPWFYKKLPKTTSDDIEMRVCRSETNSGEDVAVELIEIYLQ